MPDTLYNHLRDSISHINDSLGRNTGFKENLNFYLAIAGGIGTIIGVYAFYLQWKSNRTYKHLMKMASVSLEKEDAQTQLNLSKEELSNLKDQHSTLQKQIKVDLPIEARKAVLKDRLDESLENLQRYHKDVLETKKKLTEMGETNSISEVLLKEIESEIEPKYQLREKINNYKTLLTIISTLAGICFAVLPRPLDKYIGSFLLLCGLPVLFLLIRHTLLIRSGNKAKFKSTLLVVLACLGFIVLGFLTFFSWMLYSIAEERNSVALAFSIAFSIATAVSLILLPKLFKKKKNSEGKS